MVFALVISMLFSGSTLIINDQNAKVRLFTRVLEFDYLDWTLNSISIKISQASLASPSYFNDIIQHQIVVDYLKLTGDITQFEYQIKLIFSDPTVQDPYATSHEKREKLDRLYDSQNHIAQIAESVLEYAKWGLPTQKAPFTFFAVFNFLLRCRIFNPVCGNRSAIVGKWLC